ncbi:unnamed protein product [Effrenium voratum]|nr:unnamed protein product [Effrenium voratum]
MPAHFESLVNFVAFNHRKQRIFLPEGDPPPPRTVRKGPEIRGKDAQQANLEAQMVLRGALEMDVDRSNQFLSSVASSLYDQLSAASVEIQAETFSMMVRACMKVLDLSACRDFLLRIEAAGHVDAALLDQVMELHWEQKRQTEALEAPMPLMPDAGQGPRQTHSAVPMPSADVPPMSHQFQFQKGFQPAPVES